MPTFELHANVMYSDVLEYPGLPLKGKGFVLWPSSIITCLKLYKTPCVHLAKLTFERL